MIFYCGSTKAHILESDDFVFGFLQKLYLKINKIPYTFHNKNKNYQPI